MGNYGLSKYNVEGTQTVQNVISNINNMGFKVILRAQLPLREF